MHKKLSGAALGFCALLALPLSAHAQWWSQHPGYLHALSDLRSAYWLIQHRGADDPAMNANEHRAMDAISAAYADLQQASVSDGKNIFDQPPPGFAWSDHGGRLHRAEDLLHQAHQDISGEEDNPAARGLRARAIGHVDNAGRFTAAVEGDRCRALHLPGEVPDPPLKSSRQTTDPVSVLVIVRLLLATVLGWSWTGRCYNLTRSSGKERRDRNTLTLHAGGSSCYIVSRFSRSWGKLSGEIAPPQPPGPVRVTGSGRPERGVR